MNVIFSWLGNSDLRAVNQTGKLGPVADALLHMDEQIDRAVLMFDYEDGQQQVGFDYHTWLSKRLKETGKAVEVVLELVPKGDPTSFTWVFDAMRGIVTKNESGNTTSARHYLVGPGTSTMATCTILIARISACAGHSWQVDEQSERGYRRLELPVGLLTDAPDPCSAQADGWNKTLGSSVTGPIVRSHSTKRAWELGARAAQSHWPVLILGGTGTGKEVLAQYIHERSRLEGALISLNCGAFPESLIESELFGHKKGAFTGATINRPGAFEAAAGGTLFLDEVGELPLQAQTRFLRVLQEMKVVRLGDHEERKLDCRIIAATHRDLFKAVQDGRFRADLYYRLAGLVIELRNLDERREDLEALIESFWGETVATNPGFPGRELSEEARQRLLAHAWPGNVRELKATLVRAAFLAADPRVTAAVIELALAHPGNDHGLALDQPRPAPRADQPSGVSMKEQIKRYQRQLVEQALEQAQGNKSRAARNLEVSPQHLGRLLKE